MTSNVALVLGGGGTRGLAHLGVLQVLQREAFPIDFIVATSMGSIVAVLYALGYTPDEIAQGLHENLGAKSPQANTLNALRLLSSRSRQRHLERQLEPILADKTFADLTIPVTVMAVDMIRGEEISLQEGPLIPALLASSAVPGVFPPVVIGQRQLADGGVIDSLATHVAYQQGADTIIAVDVYPALEVEDPWNDPLSAIMGFQIPLTWLNINDEQDRVKYPNMFSSMWRSVRVMTWYLHQKRLADAPPDILLRPNVDHYGSLDFKDLTGPVQAGLEEAETHLDAIRALKAQIGGSTDGDRS